MDILNWLYLAKNKFVRTAVSSTKDLMIFGAKVGTSKRGDLYQNYAMSAEDFTTSVADVVKPYKVYTALLTQSGGDDLLSQTSGTFTAGVSYRISGYVAGDDFSNIGGPGVGAEGQWDGEWFVATGTTPLNYTNGTLIYWNTGAPVVTVLENTIGNIWFTYNNVGSYYVMSDALFIGEKTTCITSQSAYEDTGTTFIYRDGENEIVIETLGFFSELAANDILARTMLEIRVYN